MKNKILIGFVILVGIDIIGSATPISDFSYILSYDGNGIIITKYTGSGATVVIPGTIEDFPVIRINKSAFAGNRIVTSIELPDSIEVLEAEAFSKMPNLTSVKLPNGLKIIPNSTFLNCTSLTTINLPSSLEEIRYRAFKGCDNLMNLTIPNGLANVRWRGISFERYSGPNYSYEVPVDGEESQFNEAFLGCQKLPIRTRQAIQSLGYGDNF